MKYVDFPEGLTIIGYNAFKGCSSLECISFHTKDINISEISPYAFEDVNLEKCVLKIPAGTRWDYVHHPVLGKFKNIEIVNAMR